MTLNSTIAMLLLTSTATPNLNLTEPSPQMVDSTFVMEILRTVHRVHSFKNFVFYISKRLVVDTDISKDFFHGFWQEFPSRPQVLMIDNDISMKGVLSTPSLCIVLTTGRDDPIMKVTAAGLKGARFFKTIFVLFPLVELEEIYQTFEEYNKFYESVRLIYEWVWEKQFVNTILITVHNNVYIHNPYPKPEIIRKTENWTAADFFVEYGMDFKGYNIQTPIHYDLPRVFYMTRLPLGRRKDYVSGVSGKMFKAFVKHINATFNETHTNHVETEPLDINSIIMQVMEKQLEISVHSYTDMMSMSAGTSYPIGINDWCIMVPFRNRSPEHTYLEKTFHESTWLLVCFSVLYITLGIWMCTPSRERDLSLAFLQSICSMISIVPLNVLTRPTLRMRLVYVLLFVTGFFISNMYISKMASFLTASTTQPQIDTVQDVIDAQLSIMIMDFEYQVLKSKNYPQGFLDLIIISSKYSMDTHRDRFNTSFGYSVQTDRWHFFNRQQKYLKKPVFRLSSICIGPFYHVFPLQKDSHFERPLKYFIMSASQFGLKEYWQMEAFADALFLGYVRMILVNENLLPLTMSFFRSILLIWWLGLVLSGLAFCWEIKGFTWSGIKNICVENLRKFREM